MPKKELMLESVKKLLSLNVPEKDIIANLIEVGIAESESKKLIAEAKGEETEEEAGAGEVMAALKKQIMPEEKKFEWPKEEPKQTFSLADFSKLSESLRQPAQEGMNKLWEKGILATVDSKLEEMKELKAELEEVLDQKIAEGLKREVNKIEIILQSQRTLLTSKVDSSLDQRKREIDELISSKVDEIKRMNEMTQETLNKLQAQKQSNQELLQQVQKKMDELANVKDVLIQEMDASIQQSESKLQQFIQISNQKLAESDSRINRTLELETKITEGLLKDAQMKIDKLAQDKGKEIDEKITGIKKEMQAVNIDELKNLAAKMREFDVFKQQFIKIVEKNMDEFKKTKTDLETKLKEIDELKKEIKELKK